MYKQVLKRAIFFIVISIIIELAIFNRDTLFSIGNAGNISLEYQMNEAFTVNEQGKYELAGGQTGYITLGRMEGELGYTFFDIDCVSAGGKTIPYRVQIAVTDEGNAVMYSLPSTKIYSDVEKTKYVNAHSYGDVDSMRVYISADSTAVFTVNEIVYRAAVPLHFSFLRLLLIFVVITVLWCIRPSSPLYTKKWSKAEKGFTIGAIMAVNLLIWCWLLSLSPTFLDVPWEHHKQYHKLAVALTEGNLSIPIGIENDVAALENPYDYEVRRNNVSNAYDGWDTAFYEGKFYVYFGVVPVLVFYLPYYMLTGNAFQTHWGIFIAGAAILAGMFFLLHQFIKRYFKKIPFLLYVLLSVITGNCMSVITYMMRPDFYSLPIMCAMAFSLWGLGLWLSADKLWKLSVGSLCMALVAGCRPQFLLGSFLSFFIFLDEAKRDWKNNKEALSKKAIAVATPFVVVAALLMIYNFVRFGSPIDFGANYNLTTNDMTHRGFSLARISDGVFMYLMQFPNLGSSFPHVYSTGFNSSYVGKTIREAMFGGVFFTNTILFAIFAMQRVKKELKQKKLFGMILSMIAFAVVIVIADTQLAGILNRYYADFLWLLMISACLVILQMWESIGEPRTRRMLLGFVIVCGIWGICMQFGMGIHTGEIESKNALMYYTLKAFGL